MFCPKCGKSDQVPETYCRQCGTFLPDLAKPVKGPVPPEQHIRANTVLSAMTIAASFTLSILLWLMIAFDWDIHPLVYIAAGLLFAIGCWHIQTLWRTLLLRKYLKAQKRSTDASLGPGSAGSALNEANFEAFVPASVTDRTTKYLVEKKRPLSEP